VSSEPGELGRLQRRLAREQKARQEAEAIAETVLRDLYEKQHALEEAEERFRTAFDDAPIGMALVGIDGRWLEVNRSLCTITGFDRDVLLAKGFDDITLPEDRETDELHARRLLEGEIPGYRIEKRFVHAAGHPVWVSFSASLVRVGDDVPLYLITQVEDVSQRKELEQQLEHLAQSDPLTGLFNRRRFDEELERTVQLASRYARPAALLELDVDSFKTINDSCGHKAGDEVLVSVAGLLRTFLRITDVAARIGGDEFAAILVETGSATARAVAGRLVEAVRAIGVESGNVRTTASVGIAIVDGRAGQTSEEVLVAADRAMYSAKREGGDRFAMADEIDVTSA